MELDQLAVSLHDDIVYARFVPGKQHPNVRVEIHAPAVDLVELIAHLQAVGGLQGAALKKVRDDGSGVGAGAGVEKDDRKKARDEVHERPGSEDDQPPPPAFLRERSRIVRLFVLSLHCAEAANRNRAQRIGRFALFLLPKHGPHADGKLVDLYVKQLRREKVPQLMDEDQKAKHQNCE